MPNNVPRPEPNHSPPSVHAGELLTVEELCRRLRWRKHSLRQAKRLGLRVVKFGSRNYIIGADVLDFFRRLSDQQAGEGMP